MEAPMWFDTLAPERSWASLWHGYIRCGHCSGIRTVDACPACQAPAYSTERYPIKMPNGTEHMMSPAFMGGEGRYEDWVYLQMLETEWKRPLSEGDRFLGIVESKRPSPRSVIAVVFWSYFETRLERLLREAMWNIPEAVADDLLRRYASIGARIDRLYRILFSTTYWADLDALGFQRVAVLLQQVQQRRNEFAHGQPQAIDDKLIDDLVAGLKDEHESWIAVFNRRAAHKR
jgi:hypothetical protein